MIHQLKEGQAPIEKSCFGGAAGGGCGACGLRGLLSAVAPVPVACCGLSTRVITFAVSCSLLKRRQVDTIQEVHTHFERSSRGSNAQPTDDRTTQEQFCF